MSYRLNHLNLGKLVTWTHQWILMKTERQRKNDSANLNNLLNAVINMKESYLFWFVSQKSSCCWSILLNIWGQIHRLELWKSHINSFISYDLTNVLLCALGDFVACSSFIGLRDALSLKVVWSWNNISPLKYWHVSYLLGIKCKKIWSFLLAKRKKNKNKTKAPVLSIFQRSVVL